MKQSLTFDDLKQREGLPVWVEYWERKNHAGWFICGKYEWRQGWITDWIIIDGLGKICEEHYGKKIVCYDKSPTHELLEVKK